MKLSLSALIPATLLFVASCQKHQDPPPISSHYHITDFSPASGPVGAVVTLNGLFGANPIVKLNGVVADSIIIDSARKKITFQVPLGATEEKITVSFGDSITLTSAKNFIVSNTWGKLADSDGSNNIHRDGVSFVLGNKIYYGLGFSSLTGPRGNYTVNYNTDFRVFDPAGNTWSRGPSIPSAMPPRANASSFVLNGKAYIGFGDTLRDWWEYNPSLTGDAAWRKLGPNTIPTLAFWGGSSGIAFVMNNIAYAGNPGDYLCQLDPTGNGNWIRKNIFIYNTRYSTRFTLGDYFYFVGGFSDIIGSAPRWVPYTSKRDLSGKAYGAASFPVPILGQPGFTLNNKLYILYDGSTYQYDPVADIWTNIKAEAPVFKGFWRPPGTGNEYLDDYIYCYNAAVVNGTAYAWTPSGQMFKFIP